MPFTNGMMYLLGYNIMQVFGWSITLLEIIRCTITSEDLWTVTSPGLKLFQTMAVLEVLHTATGLVKSSTALTALQVLSRVVVLWCVLVYSDEAHSSISYPILLIPWTISEIVRYSFYAMGLLGFEFYPLVWLRYTLFIVLYPIGVTGELLATYKALPKIAAEQPFSPKLPGGADAFLNSYYLAVVFMLLYIPVFPKLYFHMLSQRKKVLSPQKQHRKVK